MAKITMLPAGVDPTTQPHTLPMPNHKPLLILAGGILLFSLLCVFVIIPTVRGKVEPTQTPTPTGPATFTPSPSPPVTPSQAAPSAANAGGSESVSPPTATDPPAATQTPWIVVTVRVEQRTVNVPGPVHTQIVEVPVPGPTQLVPVVTVIVQTVPWIITATSQAPTLAATAPNTPTATLTSYPTYTASPTPTGTPTPTETETPTP